MSKVNLAKGIRWAGYLFSGQLLIAVPSYLLACGTYLGWQACSIDHGIEWVLRHPVFPGMIVLSTTIGFLMGTFDDLLCDFPYIVKHFNRFRDIFAWIFVILLLIALILWGLPYLSMYLERN